jgi:hypothetical protein
MKKIRLPDRYAKAPASQGRSGSIGGAEHQVTQNSRCRQQKKKVGLLQVKIAFD